MPRSPNRTVAVAVNPLSLDDDEDNDICPVCDGDCTCNNRPLLPTVSHGNARFVTTQSASAHSAAHPPATLPLKIKLTVPPRIQNKARTLGRAQKKSRTDGASPSSGVTANSSVLPHRSNTSSTAGRGQHNASIVVGPSRKGLPPKPVAMVRDGTANGGPNLQTFGNEVTTLPQSQSISSRATRLQARSSKSDLVASRQSSKLPAKDTIAGRSAPTKKKLALRDPTDSDLQLSDVGSSRHLPTFVSADELTSEASDSSDSDSDASGFGSDLSLAAEEENYIVAQQKRHDKARVRRELLGDDVPKHRDPNNSWVIRPRKKSVGLSDVDMEGDTNDTTEEDEDEDEEMEDDDEEDDDADDQASRAYTGLATGWSDDEESSFDADLFFANLTDASSDDGTSDSDGSHLQNSATDPLADSVDSLRSVDLEVKETWDGQVVFTNGPNDGRGVLDLAFEANAAQLCASDSLSDIEMRSSSGAEDDDGDSEFGASDGETTEEELVDERGLPSSRAMKLFQWPTSVSSINPMSTVSPNVSPAPLSRRHWSLSMPESPRPADILAGKVFWESTEQTQPDSEGGGIRESPLPIARVSIPTMGEFSLESNSPQKTAVLTGANKDVPSPYPRVGHRRRRFSSSAGSFSSMDLRGRTARLSIYPSLAPHPDEPSSEALDLSVGEPIDLNDVLDSTFLDSEPEMQLVDSDSEQRLAHSLSRWDRVPVGAFRLTRESVLSTSEVPTSPGWTSEPAEPSVPEAYRNVLKNSPLHTILWHDKSDIKQDRRKRGMNISPVLLPVCDGDGDRTPTHIPYNYDPHSDHRQQQQHQMPFKTRKESRREMMMTKRKTQASTLQHFDHHQRHHHRNHHPNMKSRSNASVQRTFHSSPTSAPALSI